MDGEVAGQLAVRYPVICYLGDRRFERTSSRPKDLYDSLLIVNEVPAAGSLIQAATETFGVRDAPWPPTVDPPPAKWERQWSALVSESHEPLVGDISLDEAFARWSLFWRPLLDQVTNDGAQWSSTDWSWSGL